MAPLLPRRMLVVGGLIAASMAVASAASAFWAGVGAGDGSGSTRTAQNVILTPATAGAGLYPGGKADVSLTVSNPNTSPVRVVSIALDTARGTGGFAVDAGHAACAVDALDFTTQNDAGAGWTVPSGDGVENGVLPVTLTDALTMGRGAANACQGATVTVFLTAGP
jgi:hypothetical protein